MSGCVSRPINRVSWSASGDKVALIAEACAHCPFWDKGNARVIWLKDDRTARLPSRKRFRGLAWSPTDSLLAAYYAGTVYTFVEDGGAIKSSDSYKAFNRTKYDDGLLMWRPSGRKLMAADLSGKETREIDLDSKSVSPPTPYRVEFSTDARTAVYPEPSGRFRAVSQDPKDCCRTLRIVDAQNKVQAEGGRFLVEIAERLSHRRLEHVPSPLYWSPDGRWLAAMWGDTLCLWDWRSGDVRFIPSLK